MCTATPPGVRQSIWVTTKSAPARRVPRCSRAHEDQVKSKPRRSAGMAVMSTWRKRTRRANSSAGHSPCVLRSSGPAAHSVSESAQPDARASACGWSVATRSHPSAAKSATSGSRPTPKPRPVRPGANIPRSRSASAMKSHSHIFRWSMTARRSSSEVRHTGEGARPRPAVQASGATRPSTVASAACTGRPLHALEVAGQLPVRHVAVGGHPLLLGRVEQVVVHVGPERLEGDGGVAQLVDRLDQRGGDAGTSVAS